MLFNFIQKLFMTTNIKFVMISSKDVVVKKKKKQNKIPLSIFLLFCHDSSSGVCDQASFIAY